MKNTRIVLAILPFLICALLFSVGFSTWTLAAPVEANAETSFSVSVDPVYNVGNFISVTSIDMFKYSSLHFIDSEDAPSGEGSLVVTCAVDLEKCRQELGSEGKDKLLVQIDLMYSNLCLEDGESYDLFETVSGEYEKSVSAYLIIGENKTLCSLTNGGSYVYATAEINLDDAATDKSYFGVEFKFNVPMNTKSGIPSNFRHMFGKYLKNKPGDKTDFVATAKILNS